MKRQILQFLLLFILVNCTQAEHNENKDSTNLGYNQKLHIRNETKPTGKVITLYPDSILAGEFKKFKIYKLNDTIHSDLNSDNVSDKIFFNNKKIFVIDGLSKEQSQIGLDESFGNMGSNFSWVDFWGTTTDEETYEIIIKDDEIIGGKTIKLDNKSIFVRKNEIGGGVITYKNGKFVWIHQAD